MKKMLSALLTLCILLTACAALAGAPEQFFEVNGRVLTVRIPAGAAEVFFSGTVEPEVLAEGEENDGILSVSYRVPDAALGEEQLFTAMITEPSGLCYISDTFRADADGMLSSAGFDVLDGDLLISYGPVTGEENELCVKLEGNPSTGYEWTFIPDNSGPFELVDAFSETEAETELIVGAPETAVFIIGLNPGVAQGTLLFTYARAGGEPLRSVSVGVMMNRDGEVISVEPLFISAE